MGTVHNITASCKRFNNANFVRVERKVGSVSFGGSSLCYERILIPASYSRGTEFRSGPGDRLF